MKNLDIVALGGNAILPLGKPGTIKEQVAITESAMEQIVRLLEKGRRIVITHGNGPIVGNIVIRNEAVKDTIPPMPLDVCGADSQGGIGYMIQQAMRNVLRRHRRDDEVVSVVTQVRVAADDPAFEKPTKPIGPFYTLDEAEELRKTRKWAITEDSSRGYRRIVPSPYPLEIVESRTVRRLVESGCIVVTVGGGGVPVVEEEGSLVGREAVIDKDLSSSLLARQLEAERLIIITDVDAVYRDYGTAKATPLRRLTLEEARRLYDESRFPAGSMGSKMRAAIEFLESGGHAVIIARAEDLGAASEGSQGTTIAHDRWK